MDKLTPVGSQGEDYDRDEITRDVETEIFDTDLGRASDVIEEDDTQDRITIDSPEDVTNKATTTAVNGNTRKRRSVSDGSKRPSKRADCTGNGISDDQREQTVQALLEALKPLLPPESIPDLMDRIAKRLESDLFEMALYDRPVNALGRSSTLLTARKQDVSGRYFFKKGLLLQKVEKYVEVASKQDVELEQVQQGEVWDVIKDILDCNNT
jgi:hypothetical protein